MSHRAHWHRIAHAERGGLPLEVRDWPREWRDRLAERVALMAIPHGDLDERRAALEAEADTRRTYDRETQA